jgi:hypothetical protein
MEYDCQRTVLCRFPPALYATGKDAKSIKFNCVQRGHQQALETFPMLLAASLVGGVRYPVSVAAFGLLWMKARFAWAEVGMYGFRFLNLCITLKCRATSSLLTLS